FCRSARLTGCFFGRCFLLRELLQGGLGVSGGFFRRRSFGGELLRLRLLRRRFFGGELLRLRLLRRLLLRVGLPGELPRFLRHIGLLLGVAFALLGELCLFLRFRLALLG